MRKGPWSKVLLCLAGAFAIPVGAQQPGPPAPAGAEPLAPQVPGSPAPAGAVLSDRLSRETGCAGVFNPEQILDYRLELSSESWKSLRADAAFSTLFPARFQCGASEPIVIGVRHKSSGGASKVGLKLDFDWIVPKQAFHGLKKLNLENGIARKNGKAGRRELLSEYLAWRLMTLSGAVSSRAAFARVQVNGEPQGVYLSLEPVDKRFLKHRLGNKRGWLFKKKGGGKAGFKTRKGDPDPYAASFCFWEKAGCPSPPSEDPAPPLDELLDVDQLLRIGAVNALIGNVAGPLLRNKNYYFYDWAGGPRVYLPWDLNQTMKTRPSVLSIDVGKSPFAAVLFPRWKGIYVGILHELLEGPLSLPIIEGEIHRALKVAGPAMDVDRSIPNGPSSDAAEDLDRWWTARHDEARREARARLPVRRSRPRKASRQATLTELARWAYEQDDPGRALRLIDEALRLGPSPAAVELKERLRRTLQLPTAGSKPPAPQVQRPPVAAGTAPQAPQVQQPPAAAGTAEKTVKKAVTLEAAEQAETLYYGAVRAYAEGRIEEALDKLREGLRLNPKSKTLQKTMARIQRELR